MEMIIDLPKVSAYLVFPMWIDGYGAQAKSVLAEVGIRGVSWRMRISKSRRNGANAYSMNFGAVICSLRY